MDGDDANSAIISPRLSVIVPTHSGRGRLVQELVQGARDEFSSGTVELLVVDSSQGHEATALEEVCDSVRGCRYLRGPQDAASKRNIGGGEAAGGLLLFVDSDCLLTAETIRAHLDFMTAAPAQVGAAIGPTRMADRGDVHPWTVVRHSRMYNQCYDWPERYDRVLWGTTSNLVVRREAFEKVGGFRTMRPAPVGGEDVDFGVRLTEAGFDIATNPTAVVYHRRAHIRGLRAIARSLFHYGAADAALVDLHPHRARAHQPTQLAGAVLLGAAFAVSGRRTRAALAVGTLGYAAARLSRRGGSMYGASTTGSVPAAELPQRLAARCLDATFTLGVVVGALRRGRPGLALRRFTYVDAEGFSRRTTDPPLPAAPPPLTAPGDADPHE
ncbi:glycosyltransferase [Micromonospora sp. R77]|uniref:glycosyltransferase family 2 protein n=1 Tax=Micromonospora sp. R77 TaxID=2925836 RepID=UPI001F60C6E9|nr:glycosyltransferase family 2 protein [Micromonospora sp. R77]MCI4066811.1 glycosyltransferase [Micromonospora sp. R77]